MNHLRHAFVVLVAASLVAGCGGCGRDVPPPDPEVVSFTALPDTTPAGGVVTLSWETRHASAVTLVDGDGAPVDLGDAPARLGTVELVVDASRTFVLTAVGEEGTEPAQATAEVVVVAGIDTRIVSFTATPEVAAAGQAVVLAWETENADTVTLLDGAGDAVDLSGVPAPAGQVTVNPTVDTVYTLRAEGPGGEDEATVAVTVLSAGNIARFEAEVDGPVLPGSSVTLVWETVDATSVTLLEGDTVLLDSDNQLSGEYVVTVETTTTFTLRSEGSAGPGALAVTVEVTPVVQAFSVSPGTVRAGETVTLSWRIRGAVSAEITGPGGFAHVIGSADVAEGATSVSLPAGGQFVLTARSGDLAQSRHVSVTVTGRPIVHALTLTPGRITRGETANLAWAIDGAEAVVLYADPGEAVVLSGSDLVSGSRSVAPDVSTTYTLRAENGEGETVADAVLTVHPVPTITGFAALPARVASGGEMELSWSTVDAISVRLLEDGIDVGIDPDGVVGSRAATVLVDTVYTLEAQNLLGHTISADVHVTVGSPVVTRFDVIPDAIHPGETVAFDWRIEGGETLVIRDPVGEVVCEAQGANPVAQGWCAHEGLLDGTYVLEVFNADGSGLAETDLTVTEGPVIRSFTASPATVSVDELVMLSWRVDGPVGGGGHTLVLEDEEGTPLDLGGADPGEGSIGLFLSEPGTYAFTLRATSGALFHERTVFIEAASQPNILAFEADPERLDTQGGSVPASAELSWSTENASEVVLWQMDGAGVPQLPALFESSDPAQVAAGSLEVSPTENAFYRLIARNALGATVQRDLVIWVDLPSIDAFTATRVSDGSAGRDVDILNGEEVTLDWETRLADRVDLLPVDPVVTEYGPGQTPPGGGFLDLSTRPAARQVTLSTSFANGQAVVDFPDDFTFPFYGVSYGSAEVTSRGYLTFEPGQGLAGTGTTQLGKGESLSRNSMIAPFWEYMDVRNGSPEIWYELLDEGGERALAIQWKGWDFQHSSKRTADLNFMVKLRESGVIEFHYGTMGNSTPDRQHFSDGSAASIGFQDHNRRFGYTWRFQQPDPPPLTDTSVIFDFGRPAQGSVGYVIDPAIGVEDERTTQFLLVASNASGRESDVVTVTRWRDFASLGSSEFRLQVSSDDVEVGDTVALTWLAFDADEAEVWESGAPVDGCAAAGAFTAHGTCEVTLDEAREFHFELRARSPVSSGIRNATVKAFDALRIDAFEATTTHIDGGESVTLSWQTQGATSAEIEVLTHSGSTSVMTLDAAELDTGDRFLTPGETTHYTLRIVDADTGRVRTSTASVYVDAARITDVTASTTQVRPGETAELGWSTTNAESVTFFPADPAEVDSDFVDIRSTGTLITEWTGSDTNDNRSAFLNLPFDFAFPFDGQDRYAFTVSVNGYLTFDHAAGTVATPRDILPSVGTPTAVIAPFWTNLERGPDGEVHYQVLQGASPVEDQLVFQWSEMQYTSSFWNPTSLTFQVVLFGDGNIEFRYAEMDSNSQARADGQGATIGWQNFAGDVGGMIDKPLNEPVPGGLSHRSWRIPSGSVGDGFTVMPSRTTDYRVCASGNGWTECETITVVVVEPGHVMFSEIMMDAPAVADEMGEWFEVRNTTTDPIDIQGWQVWTDTRFYMLPIGDPIVIPPGGFFVFAYGDETVNGGFVPDAVYGDFDPDFRMDPTGDRLALRYGPMLVNEVIWDSSWSVMSNRSIAVDGSRLRTRPQDNTVASAWCDPVESYAPGLYGSPGALGRGCFHPDYDVDSIGATWIEISETGQRLDALIGTSLSRVQQVPGGLGFPMPFFDRFVSEVWVTNKGVLSFDSLSSVTSFPPAIPSTNNPDNLVAPFWTNLRDNGSAAAAVYWDRRTVDDVQVAIIQWQAFQHGTNTGVLTFQVQLWETGDIAIVMGENRSTGSTEFARAIFAGSTATVGIENHDGTDGVQFSRNEAILGRHTRVLFRRDPTP